MQVPHQHLELKVQARSDSLGWRQMGCPFNVPARKAVLVSPTTCATRRPVGMALVRRKGVSFIVVVLLDQDACGCKWWCREKK